MKNISRDSFLIFSKLCDPLGSIKGSKTLTFSFIIPHLNHHNLINVSSVYSFSKTYFVIHLESLLSFSFRYPRDTLMWRDRFTWHAHVTWHAMWRDTPMWRGMLCDVSRSHGVTRCVSVTRSRVTHQVRLERQKNDFVYKLAVVFFERPCAYQCLICVLFGGFWMTFSLFSGVVSFLALRQSRPKLVNRIASKSRHFFVSY